MEEKNTVMEVKTSKTKTATKAETSEGKKLPNQTLIQTSIQSYSAALPTSSLVALDKMAETCDKTGTRDKATNNTKGASNRKLL